MRICLFADVYGFSASVSKSSADVAKSLETLLDKVRGEFRDFERTTQKFVGGQATRVGLYFFSDNIIIAIDIDDELSAENKFKIWGLFQTLCVDIYRHSFDQFMPLRGCVSAGDIEFSDNVVLGQAIVEAVGFEKAIGLPVIFLPEFVFSRLVKGGVVPKTEERKFRKFLVDFDLDDGIISGFAMLPQETKSLLNLAREKYLELRRGPTTGRPARMWKKVCDLLEGEK